MDEPSEGQQNMFKGDAPPPEDDAAPRRSPVPLKGYRSLERLRDRVQLVTRELIRLREENLVLQRQLAEMQTQGPMAMDGTPIVFTESPADLKGKIEGFIEAIDQYIQRDTEPGVTGID